MVSPVGPYWFFLNASSPQIAVGLLAVGRLDAAQVLPEPECAMPGGGAGDAGSRGDAAQRWMRQHRHAAASDHGERLHVHSKRVNLYPVDLAAGEGAGQGVDRDVLRLDVARGLVDLAVELGHLDPAALAGRAERGVLPQQAKHMQAGVDQFLEGGAVVRGDGGKADVQLVLVVLGTDVDGGPGLRQRSQPVFSGDVGDVLHQLEDALAGAALAGEQAGLVERNAVLNGPPPCRDRCAVPCGQVEPRQRLHHRLLDLGSRKSASQGSFFDCFAGIPQVILDLLQPLRGDLDDAALGDRHLGGVEQRDCLVDDLLHVGAAVDRHDVGGRIDALDGVAGADHAAFQKILLMVVGRA